MKIFNLEPINNRKSFNNKCKVIEENGISKLQSYNTIAAEYNHKENKVIINGYYSPTTATHINAFLNYYGFDTLTKKEIENYEN